MTALFNHFQIYKLHVEFVQTEKSNAELLSKTAKNLVHLVSYFALGPLVTLPHFGQDFVSQSSM